jgi:DNA-3-methyladenine glycosylase
MSIEIKRVYEDPAPGDGSRILVDRVWPRGVTKADAHVDAWLKEVAPSTELRTWFGHVPERFDEFAKRYRREMETDPKIKAAVAELRSLIDENTRSGTQTTLVYGAKDTRFNQARVLADHLNDQRH